MAAPGGQTMFGASIVTSPQRSNAHDALLPPQATESPVLTPATSHEDMAGEYTSEKPIPIHSPFYQHPPASFERVQHSRQSSKTGITAVSEKDLESGLTPLATRADDENPFTSKVSIEHNKECKMWPSRQTLMTQKSEQKRRKHERKMFGGCAPVRARWSRLDKRQRLIMKILVALLIVGAIVGIAVGITVSVHGTYYAGNQKGQQEVGQHGQQ